MAVLGKRKARAPSGPEQPPAAEQQHVQDVFRRHFESRFEPLRIDAPIRTPQDRDSGRGDERDGDDGASEHAESEWGGLSDDDGDDDDEQCQSIRSRAPCEPGRHFADRQGQAR